MRLGGCLRVSYISDFCASAIDPKLKMSMSGVRSVILLHFWQLSLQKLFLKKFHTNGPIIVYGQTNFNREKGEIIKRVGIVF
jgi:hypothetical protein